MSRIWMGGNELGDYHADGWTDQPGIQPYPPINQGGGRKTPLGNGGNYYYYFQNGVSVNLALPGGPYSELYGRFGMSIASGNASVYRNMMRFFHGNNLLYILQVHDNGSPQQGFSLLREDQTVIANSSNFFAAPNSWTGAWFMVEWHLKLGVSPQFDLWVNGVLILTIPGLEAPMLETSTVFDKISIGMFENGNAGPIAFDDMALNSTAGTVNNGRCGDGFVIPFAPGDNGTFSGLTNNLGTKVNNFKSVAGYPSSNGFVGTNPPLTPSGPSQNQKDTYRILPLPFELGGVTALQLAAYATHNGPGVQHLQFAMIPNNNGTPETEIDFPTAANAQNPTATANGIVIPNGAFGWVQQIIEANPNNSNNPFAVSEISNGEVGIILNA